MTATLRLTDDEILALGASHTDGWRGFVPTVALASDQLVLAAERGARSLWARDLYARLDDASADDPLRLALAAAGSRPLVSAYGALAHAHQEPVGPVLNVFATGIADVVLLDVVLLDGRHELQASAPAEVEALIEGETVRASSGDDTPEGTCFVVVRRQGDERTVLVTP